MKTALVLGAGGFIGNHIVKRLKQDGFWVRGVDLKFPEFDHTVADEFWQNDLRRPHVATNAADHPFDEVYQLAADMGGAGFVFTGDNDADILHNSATINLNVLDACRRRPPGRIFYASSACVYPAFNQADPTKPITHEHSAYPAAPDSEYGWEKLFSERLYAAYARNCGLEVHVARYHNIFGPLGTWTGGREKSPAAICRKVAMAEPGGEIEIWGDGEQTRSFLYIDECVEGTMRLMRSGHAGPLNVGSDEMVSINQLAALVMEIAGKKLAIRRIPGPLGVRGRVSDNTMIRQALRWEPTQALRVGLEHTYAWVVAQVADSARKAA